VDEREQRREMPGRRDLRPEGAVALPALDERDEDGEDGCVQVVELGVGEAGVDPDERVEAPERPPRRGGSGSS
jgi:hypothetical protein